MQVNECEAENRYETEGRITFKCGDYTSSGIAAKLIHKSSGYVLGGIEYCDVRLEIKGSPGITKVNAVPSRQVPPVQTLVLIDLTWDCYKGDEGMVDEFIYHNLRELEPGRPRGIQRSKKGSTSYKKSILWEINHAKKSIRLMAYSFTCRAYAYALIAAHKRGVDVQIIADGYMYFVERNRKKRLIDHLVKNGVSVLLASGLNLDGYMHEKIMIIDFDTERVSSVYGSANFSDASYGCNRDSLKFAPYNEEDAISLMSEFIEVMNETYRIGSNKAAQLENKISARRLFPRQ